ncbi:MAG: hypothetical protein JXB49_19700 [Bacteroidales bacterium]|nr:hypothetical protein [Bacteroidales bacterium]
MKTKSLYYIALCLILYCCGGGRSIPRTAGFEVKRGLNNAQLGSYTLHCWTIKLKKQVIDIDTVVTDNILLAIADKDKDEIIEINGWSDGIYTAKSEILVSPCWVASGFTLPPPACAAPPLCDSPVAGPDLPKIKVRFHLTVKYKFVWGDGINVVCGGRTFSSSNLLIKESNINLDLVDVTGVWEHAEDMMLSYFKETIKKQIDKEIIINANKTLSLCNETIELPSDMPIYE